MQPNREFQFIRTSGQLRNGVEFREALFEVLEVVVVAMGLRVRRHESFEGSRRRGAPA
jgi:hypothetical protein